MNKAITFLPWYNQELISYLETKLKKNFNVFEYGAGNSTLFYATRVNTVCAIETRQFWINFIFLHKEELHNIEIKLCSNLPSFVEEIQNFSIKKFDLIAIDSRDRAACIYKALDFLAPSGLILLDNSERPNLKEARQHIINMGFQEIIFEGKRNDGTYSVSSIFINQQ